MSSSKKYIEQNVSSKKGKHLQTLNNAKRHMIRQVGPLLYKK